MPALATTGELGVVTVRDAGGALFRSLGWLGEPRQSWSMSGGVTTVSELPPGSWTVEVRAGDQRWQGTVTTTAASVAELVLE